MGQVRVETQLHRVDVLPAGGGQVVIPGTRLVFYSEYEDTPWEFALVLGQKYQEEIFQRGLKELGVGLKTLVELTNIPKNRVYGAIESPEHGNVLWAALDHGATRIGFAFTAGRRKAYLEFSKEAAVAEAIASVRPFNLEFKQADWWTIYSLPLHWQGDPDPDPNEVLNIAMEEAAPFTSGSSIEFDYNHISVKGFTNTIESQNLVWPGQRGPGCGRTST
ncbi:hypothetical protein LZ554_002379 [Drepanopeziza brunnea f. sp. 'monogermtubi']|nr:hypothetical protein LZ554_002379 [Drepanopeziza brunnea f. sp. 'monogermtubi']